MTENIQEDVENKIIDCIILGSGGRLIVFKPAKNKNGADLVVKRKGEYEPEKDKNVVEKIIVRARVFGSMTRKNKKEVFVSVNPVRKAGLSNGVKGQIKTDYDSIFIKNVDISQFKTNRSFYLLFVFFNIVKQDIDDYICVIPLEKFEKTARFESYLSPDKKDKYTDFLINKKDLARFFLKQT